MIPECLINGPFITDLPYFAINFATMSIALANCPYFSSVISTLCITVEKGVSAQISIKFNCIYTSCVPLSKRDKNTEEAKCMQSTIR